MSYRLHVRTAILLRGRLEAYCLYSRYEGSDLSESDEEQLFVGEVDGRESWLTAVLGCPVFVRVVRRLQSTAVCDVLTERLTPSKLYSQSLETN